MKVKCYFGRFVHMCMVAMTACMMGCSDNDEPVVPQPPTPDPDNGEVSFVIDNETAAEPEQPILRPKLKKVKRLIWS